MGDVLLQDLELGAGRQRPARAWTRLPSGRALDIMNPAPSGWADSDLCIRLSRTYRWSGESKWPLPLSVAQHSLTVLVLRRQLAGKGLPAAVELRELLHDAEEGFLGFDPISPFKAALGEPFKVVAERLSAAIGVRYALPAWSAGDFAAHKYADSVAAASEAVHCVGWSGREVREVLGIEHPILQVDPLSELYDCEPWKPWPADLAAYHFYMELDRLQKCSSVLAPAVK